MVSFKRRPRRSSVTSLKKKPPKVGHVIEIFCESKGKHTRGTLKRRLSKTRYLFLVLYEDGVGVQHDLNDETWRYPGGTYYVPGDLRELEVEGKDDRKENDSRKRWYMLFPDAELPVKLQWKREHYKNQLLLRSECVKKRKADAIQRTEDQKRKKQRLERAKKSAHSVVVGGESGPKKAEKSNAGHIPAPDRADGRAKGKHLVAIEKVQEQRNRLKDEGDSPRTVLSSLHSLEYIPPEGIMDDDKNRKRTRRRSTE